MRRGGPLRRYTPLRARRRSLPTARERTSTAVTRYEPGREPRRVVGHTRAAAPTGPLERRPVVVSGALRASARGERCTVRIPGICDGGGETTVLAHLPAPGLPAARKVTDISACFACAACHDVIDRRMRCDWPSRDADLRRATVETQTRWIAKGLMTVAGWPT